MSSAVTFPPHPDGISPQYVSFLAEASIMTAVSTLCVVLRFVHRYSMGIAWDDWCILAALVFAYGFLVTTILVATVAHAGYHIVGYTITELECYMKIALANNIIYNASITLSKASVLCFYSRVFSIDGTQRLQLRIVAGLVAGYFLAAVFGLIFEAAPVQAQWDLLTPHTTINNKAFWCAMAVINISLDLAILAIPQGRVWQLKLSLRKKILISLVFLLGAFVMIASIVRIIYLLTIDVSDLTYTFGVPGIWTNVEMNTSIICASLPIVYGLFVLKSRKPTTTYGGQSAMLAHSEAYHLSNRSTLKSAKRGQHDDWEIEVPKEANSHWVRIESDPKMSDQEEMLEQSPVAAPRVRREFAISSK